MQALQLPCNDNTLATTYDSALKTAFDSYETNAIGFDKDFIRLELEKQLLDMKEAKIK
jgi:hypothetical protein